MPERKQVTRKEVAERAGVSVAVVSYVAFKMRDGRRPAGKKTALHPGGAPAKTFFVRYQPPEAAKAGRVGG